MDPRETRFVMTPIGTVRSSRTTPEDDDWDVVTSRLDLDGELFTPASLAGLDTFSHAEVLFVMDRVAPGAIESVARHPRNNPDWPKVGIFAQRAKRRPNRIGTTVCRVVRVDGLSVHVRGLDAIDGTPLLDLKPWVREMGPRGDTFQPGWMSELMADYWEK